MPTKSIQLLRIFNMVSGTQIWQSWCFKREIEVQAQMEKVPTSVQFQFSYKYDAN